MPIVPLDRKKHAALTYTPLEDYSFTSAMPTMPLMPFEVLEASRCFAVVFPAPGSAIPHALLGLGDKNIFVDNKGKWTAAYVPLFAANYPFSLIMGPEKEDGSLPDIALAIDEDAPHFKQKKGERLYDDNGEQTELLARIMRSMALQYRRHKASERGLAELALTGAIKEQVVSVGAGEAARTVGGLRLADREHILGLPDATLGAWAKNDILEMLFGHWNSLGNLRALLDHPSCPSGGKKQ